MAVQALNVEVADIQGLVAAGYGRLKAADYLMCRVADGGKARQWLAEIAGKLTTAQAPVTTTGVNLAVTATGLQRLGLDADVLASFSDEFVEGMATPHRSRMLGDEGPSAPGNWRWGGSDQTAVDLVLMVFALDPPTLATLRHDLGVDAIAGVEKFIELHTSDLGGREQFGFNDGISQPSVSGVGRQGLPRDTLQPGEFVLGYLNEYGSLPPSPATREGLDLGRNGTYMVFRQLRQDVAGFWNFAAQHYDESGQGSPEKLAAKIVGRWPSGAPLLQAPDADRPDLASSNDFAYHAADATGLRCPIGAHIRRANPRDTLDPSPGSVRSVALVKRHRILRRGREYGPPVSTDPAGPRPPLADDGQERGLHFICLAANLVRQFEFVQGTWVASPKFAGLYDDADPLVAAHASVGASFNIPDRPFRHRLRGLPQFVTVVGGAYFFLPSIRTVRYLASL